MLPILKAFILALLLNINNFMPEISENPKPKEKKIAHSLSLQPTVIQALESLSEKEGSSVSSIANRVLRGYLISLGLIKQD